MNSTYRDDEYYNPIDLSHIFEDNDTLEPWTRELEGPLLDGQENEWLEEALANVDDEQDTDAPHSSFRHYDDDDDLYAETHAIFYTHDVYIGEGTTRDDIAGVSGSGTVGGTATRETGSTGGSDGDAGDVGGGYGVGDPSVAGGSSTSCGFTEYDSRFISTQDIDHGIRSHQLSINNPVVLLIVGNENMDMDTLMIWRHDCVP